MSAVAPYIKDYVAKLKTVATQWCPRLRRASNLRLKIYVLTGLFDGWSLTAAVVKNSTWYGSNNWLGSGIQAN